MDNTAVANVSNSNSAGDMPAIRDRVLDKFADPLPSTSVQHARRSSSQITQYNAKVHMLAEICTYKGTSEGNVMYHVPI